jgi:cytidylate kinase
MARSVSQLVEEQVVRWRVQRERIGRTTDAAREHVHAHVITLSDEFGAGGSLISALVAQQLGLPVYGREIVNHIASSARVRTDTVELLDERALSFIDDYLTSLWHERSFDRSDYAQALGRTITALWGHGPGLFVGHGAAHVIPRQFSLAVRVTAPRAERLKRIQAQEGVDGATAALRLQQKDQDRQAFIRRLFRGDIHDPLGYDLVLNTASLEPVACTAIIVEAWRRKFPR